MDIYVRVRHGNKTVRGCNCFLVGAPSCIHFYNLDIVVYQVINNMQYDFPLEYGQSHEHVCWIFDLDNILMWALFLFG